MSIYYAMGEALVSNKEMKALAADGKLRKFQNELIRSPKTAKLDFKFGTATARNMARTVRGTRSGVPIGFEPIGIGKPLTVQVRHIYTGNKAEGFWGTKDMLVASAMKSTATYDAAPRAVNFLVPKAGNSRNFRAVDATDKGTPVIFYSPSLVQVSSVVTLEVMFSNFPKEAFDAVSQALGAAAGVPVFAPASGYLVAAGLVTKLVGRLGKSLSDGTPALKRSEEISFVTPGTMEAMAKFALLISDNVDQSVLEQYKINSHGALARVDDEKSLYDGPEPYAVLSFDGRTNDDLADFTPTAASAAQLDRFYNINDGSSQPLAVLVDGLKLYNDIKFREKATKLGEKLKRLNKSSPDYEKYLTEYNAYLDNIGTKELQLDPIS